MIGRKSRNDPVFVLAHPPFEIIGVADVIIASAAMEHVGPERHPLRIGRRTVVGYAALRVDKLSTNGLGGNAWVCAD